MDTVDAATDVGPRFTWCGPPASRILKPRAHVLIAAILSSSLIHTTCIRVVCRHGTAWAGHPQLRPARSSGRSIRCHPFFPGGHPHLHGCSLFRGAAAGGTAPFQTVSLTHPHMRHIWQMSLARACYDVCAPHARKAVPESHRTFVARGAAKKAAAEAAAERLLAEEASQVSQPPSHIRRSSK